MMALQETEDEDGPGEPDPAPVAAPPPSEASPPEPTSTPVEAPAPAAPVEVKPPEAPSSPAEPPAVVPQPVVEKPPEVQGQQVAPKETPVEEPKVPKPGEFAELAQAVQQQRTALEGSLAELYAPNEKQMEEFHTEPQKVLGKLAARIHMEIVQNTLGVLAQNIPSAVNGVLEARTLHDGYESAFYKQWPQLNKADAAQKNVVMQIARSYAHTNPSANSETRIRQIGAQALVALNLLPAAAPAPVAAPVVQQQAFAPAGQASAATPQVAPAQLKGWEAIDASFEEADL